MDRGSVIPRRVNGHPRPANALDETCREPVPEGTVKPVGFPAGVKVRSIENVRRIAVRRKQDVSEGDGETSFSEP